jgi:hypothetical protein
MTGFTNNMTVVQIFLPILATLSEVIKIHPLILMVYLIFLTIKLGN